MIRIILATIAFGMLVSGAMAETATYRNARFGTSLTFPAEIFSLPMEPPASGDGMTWLAEDGASLAVYASNNALMLSPLEFAD